METIIKLSQEDISRLIYEGLLFEFKPKQFRLLENVIIQVKGGLN